MPHGDRSRRLVHSAASTLVGFPVTREARTSSLFGPECAAARPGPSSPIDATLPTPDRSFDVRRLFLAFALLLATSPALADPAVRGEIHFGTPRIVLDGQWYGALYTVYRANAPGTVEHRVGAEQSLCTGDCFVRDDGVLAGGTYWYRFDLLLPDGTQRRFGPTPVTIGAAVAPGLGVTLAPNPTRGGTTARLSAAFARAGGGVDAVGGTGEASVYDVRGRMVRELFRAPLDRLSWNVTWDGRDREGRTVPAGLYFVRFAGGGSHATARLVVTR